MTNSTTIRPFRIDIAEQELADLRRRIAAARWAPSLPGAGWDRGIPLAYLKELATYWHDGYDWRAEEAKLNEFPQFMVDIDGQPIHFLHVRSEKPDALPLLLTHGYPSSVAEFTRLIPLLTDEFHVVVPSLPGFGFSVPVHETGWAMSRTARAWVELMRRLGYERYGAHGGDIGGGVAGAVGSIDADHVVGIHVVSDPLTAANVATFLPGMADHLDPDDPTDKLIFERMDRFRMDGSGYLAIQNSRPQLLGYGFTDSPILQLAWIAEKFEQWTDLPIDRDQLLTTVSLYWFTGSGTYGGGFLYEQAHSMDWPSPGSVPQGFAIFGADETVRKLVPHGPDTHWSEFDRGKHFPAMEAPELLAGDLHVFFGQLR